MPSRKKRKRDRRRAEATAQAPKTQEGWGDGLPTSRSDLVLLRRAINEDWSVPQNVRETIVAELGEKIDSANARRLLGITKVFLAMSQANLREVSAD